ncbi:MAG: MFS transporter [bacterium]|nr:MFS transporter [bacterium]MBU1917891.1 MFS transporter [bacterium]
MSQRFRLLITISALLGIFLSALEITIVATAAPIIVRDLGGFESYAWIFTIYLLTATIGMPFWGRAADRWGRKPLFILAMVIFLIGCFLCGIAQSFTELIVFRGIQGLGGGGLLPLAFTIIADIFDIKARAKMQGAISSVWGVASILGPFIGGAVAESIGWRWIFFINIVPGIFALLFVVKYFKDIAVKDSELRLSPLSLFSSIIFIVFLLVTVTTFKTDQMPYISILGIIAFLGFIVFIYAEKKTPYPLIPHKLLTHSIFIMTCITGFLGSAILIGIVSFFPLLCQTVYDYTPTESGLLLVPFTFAWLFSSIFSTRLLLTFHYKKLLLFGFVLLVVGLSVILFYFYNLTTIIIILGLCLVGVGMAFNYPIVLITTQYDVPKNMIGLSTSAIFWIRNIGSTLGTSLMGIVLIWQFNKNLLSINITSVLKPLVTQLKSNPDKLMDPSMLMQIKKFAETKFILHDAMFWIFSLLLLWAFIILLLWFFFPKHIRAIITPTKNTQT